MLSASFGIVVGLPLLRLRGDFFAVITLGFGEIMRILLRADDFRALLGGAQGIDNIPRPVLDLSMVNPAWRFTLDTETEMYYLILAGIILVVFMTSRLGNSRIGRAWRALRADETAAQAMGIHPVRTKLLAFVLGAGIAGLAGGLAATRLYGVYPDTFTFTLSISVLALVMVGGIGSIPGDILGALLLIGLPEVFSELADYRLLIYGVLLIMVVRVRPLGLYPALFQRSAPEGG
jgi:branched-chain amino acid transport system permease protein